MKGHRCDRSNENLLYICVQSMSCAILRWHTDSLVKNDLETKQQNIYMKYWFFFCSVTIYLCRKKSMARKMFVWFSAFFLFLFLFFSIFSMIIVVGINGIFFLNSLWLVILTSIVMTIDCCHYRMLTKPWMEINDTLCDTVPYMEIVSTHKLSWHLMFVSVSVANLEWSRYWNCSCFAGEPITKFGQYLLQ